MLTRSQARMSISKFLFTVALALSAMFLFVCSPSAWAEGSIFGGTASSAHFVDGAGNYAVAGMDVAISKPVKGDVFAAAKSLTVKDDVDRGIFGFANEVNLDQVMVKGGLHVFGGKVNLSHSDVSGTLTIFASTVNIDSDSSTGAVYLAANTVDLAGDIACGGIGADKVVISGHVKGDLAVEANAVTIDSRAKIDGTLHVESAQEPVVPDGAQVGYMDWKPAVQDTPVSVLWDWLCSLGFLFVSTWLGCLLVMWLAPRAVTGARDMAKSQAGLMVGTGLLCVFVLPLVSFVLLISAIGTTVGAITGSFLIGVFSLCVPFSVCVIMSLKRFNRWKAWQRLCIGSLLAAALLTIPFVDILIMMAAGVFTSGYIVQYLFQQRAKRKAESAEATVETPQE